MRDILKKLALLALPVAAYFCVFAAFEPNNYFGLKASTSSEAPVARLKSYAAAPGERIIVGDSRLAHFDMEDLYNEFNYNTLSGLILEELEHIPQTGEKLSWRNFDFEIVDMDAARIDKVLVSLKKPEEEPVEV